MNQKLHELLDNLTNELKERPFQWLIGSSLLLIFAISYYLPLKRVAWPIVIIEALWIVSYYFYEIKGKQKRGLLNNATDILFGWYILLINFVFFIFMVALLIKNVELLIHSFLIGITIIFVLSFLFAFATMWKIRRVIFLVIPVYLIVAFMTVSLFAWLYAIAPVYADSNSGIFLTVNQSASPPVSSLVRTFDRSDLMYFSFSVFFTVSYGEFLPVGNIIRLLIVVETILSVTIIGAALNRLLSGDSEESNVPPHRY